MIRELYEWIRHGYWGDGVAKRSQLALSDVQREAEKLALRLDHIGHCRDPLAEFIRGIKSQKKDRGR